MTTISIIVGLLLFLLARSDVLAFKEEIEGILLGVAEKVQEDFDSIQSCAQECFQIFEDECAGIAETQCYSSFPSSSLCGNDQLVGSKKASFRLPTFINQG